MAMGTTANAFIGANMSEPHTSRATFTYCQFQMSALNIPQRLNVHGLAKNESEGLQHRHERDQE